MPWLPERCNSRVELLFRKLGHSTGDVDDIFTYSTLKHVRIRDARVGCLYIFSTIAWLFFLGFMFLRQGQGLLTKSPTGHIEFTTQHALYGADPSRHPSVAMDHCSGENTNFGENMPSECEPFCDILEDWCMPAFPQASRTPYCEESNLTYRGKKRPCHFFASDQATNYQHAGLSIATSVRRVGQQARCQSAARTDRCALLWQRADDKAPSSLNETIYPVGVEKFMVLLEQLFTVEYSAFDSDTGGSSEVATPAILRVMANSSQTIPFLEEQEGSRKREETPADLTCARHYPERSDKPTAPCNIKVERNAKGQDILVLEDILGAAGGSLDSAWDTTTNGTGFIRDTGAIIVLTSHWHNWYPWQTRTHHHHIHYYYTVEVFMSDYTYGVTRWLDERRDFRENEMRNGVRIVFMFTGSMRGFDLNFFLQSFAGAATLLSVASFLIDTLALNALSNRAIYRAFKYQTTQDFSQLQTELDQADEEDEEHTNEGAPRRLAIAQHLSSRDLAVIAAEIIAEKQVVRVKSDEIHAIYDAKVDTELNELREQKHDPKHHKFQLNRDLFWVNGWWSEAKPPEYMLEERHRNDVLKCEPQTVRVKDPFAVPKGTGWLRSSPREGSSFKHRRGSKVNIRASSGLAAGSSSLARISPGSPVCQSVPAVKSTEFLGEARAGSQEARASQDSQLALRGGVEANPLRPPRDADVVEQSRDNPAAGVCP